jgi:TolB-like protein/tetratricopeptide (TPR) repeat protein
MSDFGEPPPAPPASRTFHKIAVLPLVNVSADPKQEYFADALTEGLINTLGRVSALNVIARTSVTPFKRTTKSIAEIAAALGGVDAVLEGSALINVDAVGRGVVRVVVNLIDAMSQTQFWNSTIEREMVDVMSLQNEIVRLLAQGIRVAVTPAEQSRLARGGTVNLEALRLYLLGRDEWNGRTVQRLNAAIAYFKQAIVFDPGYAQAYAGLADSYALLGADFGGMPRDAAARGAIDNATRALELDPELGEAYASMGFVNRVVNWNWTLAEEQLRRALALNPSYATAHQWYGNLLSDLGREDEALAQMKRALDLDPLSAIISRDVAWPLFFARRYEEAIAQLSATLTRHPGFASAERLLARALAQQGNFADAVRRFEALAQRDTGPRAQCELAWAYALAGRPQDAARALAAALASSSPIYPYDLALVYTAMRRPNDAFAALDRAFVERDATMLNLRHDPRLDVLRTDPRFPALLTKMRFPK